jgi:CHAT domain-containing protein
MTGLADLLLFFSMGYTLGQLAGGWAADRYGSRKTFLFGGLVSITATALLMARFFELHMEAGLSPPTALRRAQLWLRGATNADLIAFVRTAVKQGRLDSGQAAVIEEKLSAAGLARSRHSGLVEWITPEAAPSRGDTETLAVPTRLARPYAHPYYWAAFIYTGL